MCTLASPNASKIGYILVFCFYLACKCKYGSDRNTENSQQSIFTAEHCSSHIRLECVPPPPLRMHPENVKIYFSVDNQLKTNQKNHGSKPISPIHNSPFSWMICLKSHEGLELAQVPHGMRLRNRQVVLLYLELICKI